MVANEGRQTAGGKDAEYVTLVDGSGNALATVASLGQKTMAGSAPVVIASDQGAVPGIESGMSSQPDNGIVSVANTSTQLVAAAGAGITKRTTILYNTGSQTISLREGAAPVAGTHFPLIAGAVFTSRSLLAINGIVASGTCTVAVISEAR